MQRNSIHHLKHMVVKKFKLNYKFNPVQLKNLVKKRPSYENFEKVLGYMKKASFVLTKKEQDDKKYKQDAMKMRARTKSKIKGIYQENNSKAQKGNIDKENSKNKPNQLIQTNLEKSKTFSRSRSKSKDDLAQTKNSKSSQISKNSKGQKRPISPKKFDKTHKVPDFIKKKLQNTFVMGHSIHDIFKVMFVSKYYFKLRVDPVRLRSFILGYCLWLIDEEEKQKVYLSKN